MATAHFFGLYGLQTVPIDGRAVVIQFYPKNIELSLRDTRAYSSSLITLSGYIILSLVTLLGYIISSFVTLLRHIIPSFVTLSGHIISSSVTLSGHIILSSVILSGHIIQSPSTLPGFFTGVFYRFDEVGQFRL